MFLMHWNKQRVWQNEETEEHTPKKKRNKAEIKKEKIENEQKALVSIEKELKELNYSVNPKDYLVKLTNFAKNNDTSITKYDLKRRYKSCNDYERIDVLRCKKENDNEYICVPDKISKCISYNTYLDTIVENHGKWKSFKERDSAMNAWIKQNNELKDIYDWIFHNQFFWNDRIYHCIDDTCYIWCIFWLYYCF